MNITIMGAHPATPPDSQPGSAKDTPRPTVGGARCSAPLPSAARRPRRLRRLPAAGVPGAMCAPECGLLDSCPKDKPAGALAKPASSALAGGLRGDNQAIILAKATNKNVKHVDEKVEYSGAIGACPT